MSQTTIPDDFWAAASASHHRQTRGPDIGRVVGDSCKRLTDVLGSAALLLFLSPLLATIWVLVRTDGGPALFRHDRIGRGGAPFRCLKFRTMVPDSDRLLHDLVARDPRAAAEWRERRKLSGDPRITRIGRFLRITSLDELPQLINVLRGEMSLVGPRPVVQEELDLHYGPLGAAAYQAQRPGLTGPWQVSGRSDTTYRERVLLDMRYAAERSFAGDLRILLSTVPSVLARRGAI
jgi:lipopolysaccharide/colanic/teichoic acid biosynthesis glycosyltransferase